MNTEFENILTAASDKARELKSISAELLCGLAEGRHYVLRHIGFNSRMPNLCFASKNNHRKHSFAKDSMTEFGAIGAAVPSAASAESIKTGFVQRRRERFLAEERQKRLCELKEHIEYAKSEINAAMSSFNNVTEPKLIDYYIYKIQSEQNRFEQLLIEYKSLCGIEKTFPKLKKQ